MAKRSQAFRNGDARRRAAERSAATGDLDAQARAVVELIRAGEFAPVRVEVAAALGHPVAKLVEPDVKPVDQSYNTQQTAASRLAGPLVSLSWAADVIERFRGDGAANAVPDTAVAVARRAAARERISDAELEELSGAAYHAQEAPAACTPLKAFMDGVYALAIGMRYGISGDEPPRNDWIATHAVATVSHIAACMYRSAEPIPDGEAARKSPARDAAFLRTRVISCLRLADYLMDPTVELTGGDDGAEWIRLREEEKRRDREIERMIEETISDMRDAKS